MRIYLIGFMGCGKSTGGKKLSARMNLPLFDIDKIIEASYGLTVSELFAAKGEEHFRKIERDSLHDTLIQRSAIISCGGGTPCYYDNMGWMKENGVTVYLKCSPGFLFSRLHLKKAKRPLIANMDDAELQTYILDKLQQREVYYNKADIIFSPEDTDYDVLQDKLEHYIR